MIQRLKEIWHKPRDMLEAEWYILLGIFIMIWMWMII
jgi:hypothetical protein